MAKTFIEMREEMLSGKVVDNELNEISLRTAGGVVLAMKIQTIGNEIKNVKISGNDDLDTKFEKLFKKMDLKAKQDVIIGWLVAQLGIMSKNSDKRRGRR
jgi:hypothetical protein